METFKALRGGFVPFVLALAFSLAAFITEAKAATVGLGNVSSASGSIVLNNGQAPTNNLDLSTDTYSFTLTDAANVSGLFGFDTSDGVSNFLMDIDVNSIAGNLVHTTAVALHFDFSIGLVFASPGLFSLDLTPGSYTLALTGGRGPYSGTLAFAQAAVATTPVPAALPLFASALGGLGFAAWRRKKRSLAL
uniref:Putative RTX toxin n=1 Tax=uncultured bacterium 878 TaxID=548895 RepID=B8R8L4_9BACT|nr:putative RTX toxin [uncultured bacterium 878]